MAARRRADGPEAAWRQAPRERWLDHSRYALRYEAEDEKPVLGRLARRARTSRTAFLARSGMPWTRKAARLSVFGATGGARGSVQAAGPAPGPHGRQAAPQAMAPSQAAYAGGGASGRGRLPHLRLPRPRRLRNRALLALLTVVAVFVALYMALCSPVDRAVAFDRQTAQSLSGVLGLSTPVTPYYALLLGSDAREGDTVSRTDTIILARVDPVRGQVSLVSIPRDTMVQLEGYGTQKINAAYAFGGAPMAVQAVEQLCGVSVAQVAVIDFDGLATLVDAIGGVTVDVPVDVDDPDYTGLVLPAGTYEMDGETALAFARARHGFALGDYQRQADQQILVQAIIDKVRSHPTLVAAAASSMGDVLSTTMRCYHLVPVALRSAAGGLKVYAATIPSGTQTVDGVSYVVADQQGTLRMMEVVSSGRAPSTVANGLQ